MTFAQKFFRTRDGLMLAYRDYPSAESASYKPTVLCLAGMTRNSKDFDGLAPWVAGLGHRVICLDYRGRGLSDYDSEASHYTPETYMDDVRHLLIVTGIHHVIVIGTSLGGLLAMAMSAAVPTVLAGAVINDVGPVIRMGDLSDVAGYIKSKPLFTSWPQAIEHIKRWFPDFPATSEDEWLAIAKRGYKERSNGDIVFDFDPAIGDSLEDKNAPSVVNVWPLFLGLKNIPVACIRGAKSDLFTADLLSQMAAKHSNFIQATVPDVGHAPSLGEPESIGAIKALLDCVD